MTAVRVNRRPPFAWIALDALALIRRTLPGRAHMGARTALLAMAEAASRRHDGNHAQGDPLRDLAALAGLSERRLLDHLRELESLGLVRIEEQRDEAGRDRPKLYALVDGPDVSSGRGDESSGRSDVSALESSGLTRASEGVELQEEEPPKPPQAGADIFPAKPNGYREHGRKRQVDLAYDDELDAFMAAHFPGVHVGLVAQGASNLRARNVEPTVEALRPWVEHWQPTEAELGVHGSALREAS